MTRSARQSGGWRARERVQGGERVGCGGVQAPAAPLASTSAQPVPSVQPHLQAVRRPVKVQGKAVKSAVKRAVEKAVENHSEFMERR